MEHLLHRVIISIDQGPHLIRGIIIIVDSRRLPDTIHLDQITIMIEEELLQETNITIPEIILDIIMKGQGHQGTQGQTISIDHTRLTVNTGSSHLDLNTGHNPQGIIILTEMTETGLSHLEEIIGIGINHLTIKIKREMCQC